MLLCWFSSYVADRSHIPNIKNVSSDSIVITHGVPQDSVLGPVLFTLYITPLSQIKANYEVSHHLYADVAQSFNISLFNPNNLISLEKNIIRVYKVFPCGWPNLLILNPN